MQGRGVQLAASEEVPLGCVAETGQRATVNCSSSWLVQEHDKRWWQHAQLCGVVPGPQGIVDWAVGHCFFLLDVSKLVIPVLMCTA